MTSTTEKVIAALIVAVIVLAFIGTCHSTDEFRAACAEAGGSPVWNGRHHECLIKR